MKIVILDGYCLNPGDLSWSGIEALGECVVYDRTMPSQVLERAKDSEILFTNKTILDAETIQKLHSLRYIGVLATGYDVVDIQAAYKHNIVVTNIPSYSTESVAQMVFAHVLNIVQRVDHYANENRQGRWSNHSDFAYWDGSLTELAGKRIGIVGYGNIGKTVARIAKAFSMEVYVTLSRPLVRFPTGIVQMDLDTLFSCCDIVTLHCPLKPGMEGMVNARLLSLMKPSSILINTARGQLINEADLADALNRGVLYAAGLDVLSQEPPRADNPLLTARNCFITPHIAWATLEARKRLMQVAENNLRSYLKGNVVNNVATLGMR